MASGLALPKGVRVVCVGYPCTTARHLLDGCWDVGTFRPEDVYLLGSRAARVELQLLQEEGVSAVGVDNHRKPVKGQCRRMDSRC